MEGATENGRRGVLAVREGEGEREGVRNDYLSFKTNSQVSAKSSANQRVEGGRAGERGRKNPGRSGLRGEIIC